MKREHDLESFYKNSFWSQFSIKAEIEFSSDKWIQLTFNIKGPLTEILLTKKRGAGVFKEKLWETTCFEFFYSDSLPAYQEWNFSPSEDYWSQSFFDYRTQQKKNLDNHPPQIEITKNEKTLTSLIKIPLPNATKIKNGHYQLAVITESLSNENKLNYWAINHSYQDKKGPDFHNQALWNILN